jgi:predicted metal-dependent HD superfamily phosphohydrolase
LKSAELAAERLRDIGISEDKIEKCRDQILATKHHKTSEDMDSNYFLDADLAILGSSEEKYQEYKDGIRMEYKLVPRGIYRKGRMKLVKKFLSMDRIYKTDHFYEKYEERARANLTSELKLLQ